MKNKIYACILGGAVGDACGAPYEWVELKSKIKDFPKKRGTHNIPVGAWTDDTALTLAMGLAIVYDNASNNPNMTTHLNFYSNWVGSGVCVGLGRQTRDAIQTFDATKGSYKNYGGKHNSRQAGNGSLMRTASASIAYFSLPAKQRYRVVEKCSSSTHNGKVCKHACVAFDKILHQILLGEKDKTKLLDIKVSTLTEEIKTIFEKKSYLNAKQIEGSGYVVKSLEAVIHCFVTTDSYEAAILKAVNLGGDTDTTAAITGQLAGAYYGISSIPKHWRRKIKFKNIIKEVSKKLEKLNVSV